MVMEREVLVTPQPHQVEIELLDDGGRYYR